MIALRRINNLLGVSLPVMTKQRYMGDYAYFFDIDSRYSGYTRDKIMFHVLDKNTNAYTSYESQADFLSWLESYLNGGNTPQNVTVNESGVSFIDNIMPQSNAVKIGIGVALAAGIIYYINKK